MSNKNNRKKILHRINLLLLPYIVPNGPKTIPYATVLARLAYTIERRFSQGMEQIQITQCEKQR